MVAGRNNPPGKPANNTSRYVEVGITGSFDLPDFN